MCCHPDKKITIRTQRRTKPFIAYKVIFWMNASSFHENHYWKPGIHIPHQTHREYDPTNPHGFHFFFTKKAAKKFIKNVVVHLQQDIRILSITVDPKDVIAAEATTVESMTQNDPVSMKMIRRKFRQGVAIKITVTQQNWNEYNV